MHVVRRSRKLAEDGEQNKNGNNGWVPYDSLKSTLKDIDKFIRI